MENSTRNGSQDSWKEMLQEFKDAELVILNKHADIPKLLSTDNWKQDGLRFTKKGMVVDVTKTREGWEYTIDGNKPQESAFLLFYNSSKNQDNQQHRKPFEYADD